MAILTGNMQGSAIKFSTSVFPYRVSSFVQECSSVSVVTITTGLPESFINFSSIIDMMEEAKVSLPKQNRFVIL